MKLHSILDFLTESGVAPALIQQTGRELRGTNLCLAERFLVLGGDHVFFADTPYSYRGKGDFFIVDTLSLG